LHVDIDSHSSDSHLDQRASGIASPYFLCPQLIVLFFGIRRQVNLSFVAPYPMGLWTCGLRKAVTQALKEVFMQVHFTTTEFELTPSLRDHLARRLRFAFVSIQYRIQSISVRLRDLNGPKGGRDMLCQVAVVIPGRPTVLIKDIQEDMYAAIDSAFKRASYRATQIVIRQRNVLRGIGRSKNRIEPNFDQQQEA
jgi:putative sigma-54 modulation protein